MMPEAKAGIESRGAEFYREERYNTGILESWRVIP